LGSLLESRTVLCSQGTNEPVAELHPIPVRPHAGPEGRLPSRWLFVALWATAL